MKVLLFGGGGQIGAALRRQLAAQFETVAPTRSDVDLMLPGRAAAAIRTTAPDVVINAAAWTAVDAAESEPEAARRLNAEAVAEIAAAAAGRWLVQYSTDYVFDGGKREPYFEDDAANPLSVYGRTKREGELAVLASGSRGIVLRTSWVHAPGHRNFATAILDQATRRAELRVVDDQLGAPTGAALVASVTGRLLEAIAAGRPPDPGIYHVAAGGCTNWCEYARYLLARAEEQGIALRCRAADVRAVSSDEYPQQARRPRNSRLATAKIEAALGITLPDWRDGVDATLREMLPEMAA